MDLLILTRIALLEGLNQEGELALGLASCFEVVAASGSPIAILSCAGLGII